MGRASGVGARCWGTPVEFGCLLTYRQLISGCRAVRNLSPTGALFLFHDVRLYDPERRLVRGPPRKCLGMCRRVTNKGESGFGIANDRGTVAVEWKHHRCDRLKRQRDLSIEVSVLRGWDPKVPVGSPVSFPKRSNPAWRLVAPSSPCRINTKSKHQRTSQSHSYTSGVGGIARPRQAVGTRRFSLHFCVAFLNNNRNFWASGPSVGTPDLAPCLVSPACIPHLA